MSIYALVPKFATQIAKSLICLAAIGMVAGAMPVQAQGGADYHHDTNFALQQMSRTGCAVAVDPRPPHNSFVFREFSNNGGPGPRFSFTTMSPGGGVHTYNTGTPLTVTVPYPVRISQSGQNVAIINLATGGTPLQFSQDYGTTFTGIPLQNSAPWSLASHVVNRQLINNMVFGSDGKLYVFYITFLLPAPSQPWDRYRLNLMVVNPNGTRTSQVLATLSGTIQAVSSPGLRTKYIDVISTQNHVIAFVSPGPTYQANAGATPHHSVPAAFVVDIATQSVQTISFGGNLGTPSMTTFTDYPVIGESMLASDGLNLFTVTGHYAFNGKPNFMIREFPFNTSRVANYFINTAAPGDQPYMNLEDPALQFGTEMKDLNLENGTLYQITAKWPVQTIPDHSVDVLYYTEAQITAGTATDVQRTRILDPNTGLKGAAPILLNDFPAAALATVGISLEIQNYSPLTFPTFSQQYSTNSVSDAVTTTFCQRIFWQNGPSFVFHSTDVS